MLLRNRTACHQPKSGNDAYDGFLVAETLSGLGVAARLCDRGFVPRPAFPPAGNQRLTLLRTSRYLLGHRLCIRDGLPK